MILLENKRSISNLWKDSCDWKKIETDFGGRVKYNQYIDYCAKLTEEELVQYEKEFLAKSEKKEEIMGLFEMKRREGEEKTFWFHSDNGPKKNWKKPNLTGKIKNYRKYQKV